MNRFKAGDEVKFLNDVGGGVIKGFDENGWALVETEDGFVIPTTLKNLISIVPDYQTNEKQRPNLNAALDYYMASGDWPSIQYYYDERSRSFAMGFNNPLEKRMMVQIHWLDGKKWKSLAILELAKGVKIFHRAERFDQICNFDKLWVQCIELSDFESDNPLFIHYRIKIAPEKFAAFNDWEIELSSNAHCLSIPLKEFKPVLKNSAKATTTPDFYIQNKNIRGEFEIDLHAYALPEFYQSDDPKVILKRQLAYFDKCINELMFRKIRVLQVIHGTGEGVLKSEVRQKLREAGAEILDAPMNLYGVGATTAKFKH
ncbi:MAG: Smr/MutS family protein [Flavobacteriales bacterium]